MFGCSMHISGIAVAANLDSGVRCGRIRAQAFRVHVMVDRGLDAWFLTQEFWDGRFVFVTGLSSVRFSNHTKRRTWDCHL
jgi:hypothetical protein